MLVLNEEQRMLKDSAREFIQANAPVEALRSLRDKKDAIGYSKELWQQMVELGWTAIALPEAHGGLAFGFKGLGVVLEEIGHTLAASPLLSTVVLGASAIELSKDETLQSKVLPKVIAGELTLALALDENHHHQPSNITTTAEKQGDSWILNGKKTMVIDGHTADKIIVVARTSGGQRDTSGLTLFLIDGDAQGIQRTPLTLLDAHSMSNITLNDVAITDDAVIGDVDNGWSIIEPTLDRGCIAIATEMMGGCLEMFNRTMDYLKEREQFDVKIGSFQALKHRASIMFTEIELNKSVLLDALNTVDEKPENLPKAASLAKARLGEAFKLITDEATQMHGGIGVTDELDVGLFKKRSRVLEQLLGNSAYHRSRYASLSGF